MNKDVIMIIAQIAWYRLIRYQNDKYHRLFEYNDFHNYLRMGLFFLNYRHTDSPVRYSAIWNLKTRNIIAKLPKKYK
jgi:hypothetical protein